jgi:transposase-like protein
MVLPFMAAQRVEITCPHCATTQQRLAAAVRRRSMITCKHCKRRFKVTQIRVLIGSARR